MELRELFDAEFYQKMYPETRGQDAFDHFMSVGWLEGKNPHPLFDTKRYLQWYPDVQAAGKNPLVHFIEFGYSGYKPHVLFDSMGYLSNYPEVKNDGANPLIHYLKVGGFKGYNPHIYFDSSFYLERYSSVKAAGINPLVDYVTEGHSQGRIPHPVYFDPELYVSQVQVENGLSPLEDYLKEGIPSPILSPFNYLHTQVFKQDCRRAAEQFSVVPDVDPTDLTMGYAVFHEDYAGRRETAVQYYFKDGAQSAKQLADLVYDRLGFQRDTSFQMLEFASGYGRVARHWSQFVNSSVTTCDIHSAAVDFNSNVLSVPSVLSSPVPESLALPGIYDVIFCLSFFTHMPERTFEHWLNKLYDSLSPNGVLIFTTHGATCAKIRNVEVGPQDFYFTTETEQHDISTVDYGYTIVMQPLVEKLVSRLPGQAKLEVFHPDYYWNIQDLYAVRKVSGV